MLIHTPGQKITGLSFFTFIVVTISGFMMLAALLVTKNIQQVLSLWGKEIKFSVYLDQQALPEQIEQIKNQLESNGQFKSIQFKNSNESAQAFKTKMNQYTKDLFSEEELAQWMPASFEILVSRENIKDMSVFLGQIENQFKSLQGVEEVSYGQQWVSRVDKYIHLIQSIGYIFSGLVMGIAFLLIGSSIRQSVYQRTNEIQILELVGATPWLIRKPFLVEAAIMGFLSSVFALTIGFGLFRLFGGWLRQELYSQFFMNVKFFNVFEIFSVIAVMTFVSAVGGYIYARSINTGWASAQK